MDMDLRLLRYFVATADAGSATGAARMLHVTQPVLSRQVRSLERRLGIELLERDGRGLTLTPGGRRFLPQARDLLARADTLSRAAAGLADGRLTHVRVAVPTTTLADVVAPFLATLSPDDPLPTVRELDSGDAGAALSDWADLAIVSRPPAPAWASRRLGVLPVWAYPPPTHRLAGRAVVPLSDLVAEPLVLLTRGFRPRELLDIATENAGLSYRELVECGNAQVAQSLAAAGRGIAVVSDDPRFELSQVRIATVTGDLTITLYAAWDVDHPAAGALAAFADRLARFCSERYEGSAVKPARQPARDSH